MNPIDIFLVGYSYNTKATYKGALRGYFELLGTKPETYFTDNRNYDADILCYADSIKGKFAPKTYHTYISCLRELFSCNNISLDHNTKKKLNRFQKTKEPITRDRIPTQEELKNILSYANLRDKAIYLTLLSSGMRVGEVTQITTHDIFMGEKPVRIELEAKYCKNKQSRTVFISNEAKRYLEKWLTERESWLENDAKRGMSLKYKKNANDERIFPLTTTAIRVKWNKMLDKVNLGTRDRKTGIREIHVHCLRKYFRTHIVQSCSRDVAEILMGHKGYLTDSYFKLTNEELAKEYKKGENELTIFESMGTSQIQLEKMRKIIKNFVEVYGADAFEELAKTKGEFRGPVSHGLRLDPEQLRAINKQMRKKRIDELKALAEEL
jgi:integrase